MLSVTGVLARAPGHATSATLGLILLIVAAVAACSGRQPRRDDARQALRREGLLVALAVALVLSIPFAISGRWGPLGVGFNNDLGLHLAWAEWLRSGLGPTPEAGYPLGPHALAVAVAAVPGIGLGQAFVGEIFAIGILTALTAQAALPGFGAWRRTIASIFVADLLPRRLLLRAGRFQGDGRGALRARLRRGPADTRARPPAGGLVLPRFCPPPYLALAGGIFFSYSFAGLAWPVAILVLWGSHRAGGAEAARPTGTAALPLTTGDALSIIALAWRSR